MAFDSRRGSKMNTFCKNPHLTKLRQDFLYHLGINSAEMDLRKMFGDVKYVVMGGSPNRMKRLASFFLQELSIELPAGHGLVNISGGSDRYALYKAGPILSVSHGMGNPSISILLHEIVKLIEHAGCKDVLFLRLGTCGGLGVKPGTVVISNGCMDGLLNPYQTLHILGKTIQLPAVFCPAIVQQFKEIAAEFKDFETVAGKTMCANGFYEEQGRLDGAICQFSEEEKMAFLHKVYAEGVRNMEMESLCFAATCNRLDIKAVVICVTFLDRLQGDQVTVSHEILHEWEDRPALIASKYILRQMAYD